MIHLKISRVVYDFTNDTVPIQALRETRTGPAEQSMAVEDEIKLDLGEECPLAKHRKIA